MSFRHFPLRIILFYCVIAGCSSLNCFNCGADINGEECLKPSSNLTFRCIPKANEIPVCFSYFFNSTKSKNTGAYRGCYNTVLNEDLIVVFRSYKPGETSNIRICKTDNCNNIKMNKRGIEINEYPELSCYECNPKEHGDGCLVANTSVSVKICKPAENKAPKCFSYFIKSSKNDTTGAYRGCTEIDDPSGDVCDSFILQSYKSNDSIFNCTSCQNTKCNAHLFNYKSTASYVQSRMALLMFNLFLYYFIRTI